MSAMANTTLIMTTVTKTATKEKTPNGEETASRINILDFCEEHYEDILPVMNKIRRNKRRKAIEGKVHSNDLATLNRQSRLSPGRTGNTLEMIPTVEVFLINKTLLLAEIVLETEAAPTTSKNHMVIPALIEHGTNRRKPTYEEDLAVPWSCEEVDPFTPRIRNFKSLRKTQMPNNVKTYDGTGDPEDHVKIFQAAAQVERWAMPTWCHMFNSTLIGTVRQKKYVKDPMEIHNIKQKDGETIEEFMHGVNNPELIKRLNEHVPKTLEEMMTAAAAFIRGETAVASKKKVHTPWKSQDLPKWQNSERRSDFRSQPRDGRGSKKFTPFTRMPKEIFVAESGKFKPPPPMVTLAEKRSSTKFCELHNDKGHNTNECVELRKQIEELVRVGKLSHFIKEIRRDKDQQKTGKKDAPVKDKAAAIYMIQPWQRVTRQKVTQSFAHVKEITFLPLAAHKGTWGPLVIEAKISGHAIHRIYVDRGSSMELRLLVTIGDAEHYTRAWMNFMIVRSPSPYNGIIGRPEIREIQAVPSTAHRTLKFPMKGGIVTIRSTFLMPTECTTIAATHKDHSKKAKIHHKNFEVAIHPDFPDQEITTGGTLSIKTRIKLCTLLKRNLDIFAWQPSDMTGVPRSIAEHRLNIREGYSPVRQKKRGQALKRAKAIQVEVQNLVEAEILIVTPFQKSIGRSNPFAATPLSVSWMPIKAIIKYRWPNKMKKRLLSTPVTGINMKLNPKKCTFGAAEGMFLGYMINPKGMKPCLDKTEAVLQLPSPQTIKEVQSLNRKLASLNRFISKSAEKSLPLFKTLKNCIKKSDFHWTPDAEQAFKQLKQHLARLPMLVAPKPDEELIMYLSASYGAISAVLMTERDTVQTPVYFLSRALQTPKLNYTPNGKARHGASLRSLLPGASHRGHHRPAHQAGQILADFLVEKPDDAPLKASVIETPQVPWTLFTDGSSCVDGSSVGLILTSPEGTEFTYALRFQFPACNNEVEYEALIAG
uniref:Reverse transcriptase domain-containing protein n=1 Tax=Tanacetum cinerariifolium TaxID=118510 RepID=A0A699H7M5_TANCI|nr:reverse transcriptase domain-containing protein [Tanacetum cinerariifolium]GEX55903.1 reverse transcriptase domain-containing protein [Tanacetum cinerariifolium]